MNGYIVFTYYSNLTVINSIPMLLSLAFRFIRENDEKLFESLDQKVRIQSVDAREKQIFKRHAGSARNKNF